MQELWRNMMNEKLNDSNKTLQNAEGLHNTPRMKGDCCHVDNPTAGIETPTEAEGQKSGTGMERAKDAAASVASSMAGAATYVGHKAHDVTASVGVALENTGNFLKARLDGDPKIENLRDFYVQELKDLYSAEHQLLKALPKMAKMATALPLNDAFEHHIAQTLGHVGRLDVIFKDIGVSPGGNRCRAMEGIVIEAEELLAEEMPDAVKDAALIAAAQRMEHYEMAGYGCVRTYARILGEHKAAGLLDEILQEEGATDLLLSGLAEGSINQEATAGV